MPEPEPPAPDLSLPYSCRCGVRWGAAGACHCGHCHVTFADEPTLLAHKAPRTRHCRDPRGAGLTLLPRTYPCWGHPTEETT
jgi:hypothetical protein